jgi:ubiquinone/menaquinone biosynthesis C-methylase UbiE
MATKATRWEKAQAYEEAWWRKRIDSINLEYLRHYADELVANLDRDLTKETNILEIGSGPAGILTFLKSDHRFAIDPLEGFFAQIEKFSNYRDENVKYFEAKSESLPFKNSKFHLVIIDNVLDHCESIPKVFSELSRVLKAKGIIYLRLNVYHVWGRIIRLLAERFQIDKGHPHTFTRSDLIRHFKQGNFAIIKEKSRGIFATWIAQLTSLKLKDFLKAISFSSPDTIIFVLSRSKER